MPDRIFGIYGFDFTRSFVAGGADIIPLYQYPETETRASDRNACLLTGYARFHVPSTDAWNDVTLAHLIVDAMTFAQQQHVVGSQLVDISAGDSVEEFIASSVFQQPLIAGLDRKSFGRRIAHDRWSRHSIPSFINAFVDRFKNEQVNDPLRRGMYRQLEISRLATPFVELHHFLAFSGLEIIARSEGANAGNRNAGVPIADLLKKLGFEITQTEVERWTRARNAAFHEGQLTSPDPNGGPPIRLADQLLEISNILADVCLKLLPFDDGHINWKRWRDRMPFT